MNDVAVTVVGVAPRGFAGTRRGGSQMRVWLRLNARPIVQHTNPMLSNYDSASLGLAAWLAPGVEAGRTVSFVWVVSPAARATRVSVADVLKNATNAVASARSRLQSGLVVAQIVMTQPLLLGLGALILGLVADLQRLPAPVFTDRIARVTFNTNPRYGAIDVDREEIMRRLQDRIAALLVCWPRCRKANTIAAFAWQCIPPTVWPERRIATSLLRVDGIPVPARPRIR